MNTKDIEINKYYMAEALNDIADVLDLPTGATPQQIATAACKEIRQIKLEAQEWRDQLKLAGIREGEPYDEFLKRLVRR